MRRFQPPRSTYRTSFAFFGYLKLFPIPGPMLLPAPLPACAKVASDKPAAKCPVSSAKPKTGLHPALPPPSPQSASNRSLKHSASSATATWQPYNFRCTAAGPFPPETLGRVPRQNRPCDRLLLWPNCGLHLASSKSVPCEATLKDSGSSDSGHHTLALIAMYAIEMRPQWKKLLIL